MAGGIFPNYPFELNAKCIIFSLIIIGLFFYSPPPMKLGIQLLASFILFVIAYVAMAWYDYEFQCTKLALKKSASSYGITGKFKPPAYAASQIDKAAITAEEIQLDAILIHLLHLLIFAPVLVYISLLGNKSPRWAIIMLIMSLLFATLYHGVRLMHNTNNIIAWLHITAAVVIIPLAIMSNSPPAFYYMLLFTGFYVALKHGLSLINISHKVNENEK